MSTLTQLQSTVAAFLGLGSTGSLTKLSQDLFLSAVNNAIKTAQLIHDFEDTRCTATLNIDAVVGGNLSDAIFEAGASQNVTAGAGGTPDVTGTFVESGQFNLWPMFILFGSTSYFLYYNTNTSCYVISTNLSTGNPTNYYANGTSGPVIPGTYTHHGTYSGSLTVSQSLAGLFSGIKTVLAVMRQRPDGTYIPLDFARADIPIERDRTELEFSDNLFPYLRYPSDAQINARGTNSSIIQRGQNLSIYPRYTMGVTTPFNVLLECFGWLTPLTSSSYNDVTASNFLFDYGYEWLQWAAICELNFVFKNFTPRTEGNLGAPEQYRDAAWQKLILFDSYRVDANTTRSR